MAKRSYKTVLLGDASVGKSSFAVRLTKGEFSDNTNSTIGAAFFTYTVRYDTNTDKKNQNISQLDNNESKNRYKKNVSNISDDNSSQFIVKFDIWDTAGQERFKSIAPIYYRGAACAIVILDISSSLTLQNAVYWINQLRVANNNETIIILVANKIDLLGTNPETVQTLANAKSYAKEQSITFVETSAKTGQNIAHVFELLAQEISLNPSRWDKNDPKVSGKTLKIETTGTSFCKRCSEKFF